MKKSEGISALLGISQSDMAVLLQVSRSQYAMYELKERDLPLSAKIMLTALLGQVQQSKSAPKVMPVVAQQEQLKQNLLERQLKENTYQQIKATQKLAKMEQVYNAQLQVLALVDFLKTQATFENLVANGFLKKLENKSVKKLAYCGLPQITQLQIKLATLQEEARILHEAMGMPK